ncbi:Mitochondrial matrix iron chaperone [Coemansia erecta]|nr:Mitochondrial matrix iron chaperone [Coemansia erecta]
MHAKYAATKTSASYKTASVSWHQQQQQQKSLFSSTGFPRYTQTKNYTMAELDDSQYHSLSSQTMDSLTEYFEDLGDKLEMDDYDIEYSSGVLTLRLGAYGTYVINKQPPNKQIWLSSPVSGPERYDYDKIRDAWFCRHKDESLGVLLNREISEALKIKAAIPIN